MFIFALFSEYRTYLIDVHISEDKHIVLKSTLDHVQYLSWNAGIKKVDLLDSWMCFGDTSSYKEICEKNEIEENINNDKQ